MEETVFDNSKGAESSKEQLAKILVVDAETGMLCIQSVPVIYRPTDAGVVNRIVRGSRIRGW